MDRNSFAKRERITLYAAIDIGTNTVLLLAADAENGRLVVHHEEQRMPRLGRGVDQSKNLHPDSMQRVLKVLKEYKAILENQFQNISDVAVTATSAVRDANNREYFIRRVNKETGFDIQLLSGLEEAEYTYIGALSVLPDIRQRAIVIDIGGGSTEIASGENGRLRDSHSFDMGSVRFTERYLGDGLPGKEEICNCRNAVKEELLERPFNFNAGSENPGLVGVAGTVTSLAYMDLELDDFETEKINGHPLSLEKLSRWIERISSMSVLDLKQKFPKVMEGRADVFLGGLLILEGFMKYYSISELTVSTGGIRHGALLSEIKKGYR